METRSDRQIILLPKAAIDPNARARNSLFDLLLRSGYDKINDGFDRKDEIIQGDYIFRGIKGAEALAAELELFRNRSVGILMGSDVLAEADALASSYGIRANIQRLLTLDIGRCSLTFLSPQEKPILSQKDLDGRRIFTKYSSLLQRVLRNMRISASVRRTDGADTRVNEWRDEAEVAAFEIVGSGDTARKNGLQVVGGEIAFPAGAALDMPYLSLSRISTDVYVSNIRGIGSRARTALQELGLALESVKAPNRYTSLSFNIPTALIPRFTDFGLKGPTISPVASRDGSPWSALEIYVPLNRKNAVRRALLARGAADLSSNDDLHVEVSADQSEVLAILPFEERAPSGLENGETADADGLLEFSGALLALDQVIAERAQNGDASSGTWRSLQKGVEFCAAKCAEELLELQELLQGGDGRETQGITEESADVFYRFLVGLRSRGVGIADVAREGTPRSADAKEAVRTLLAERKGDCTAPSLLKAWTTCSTALRKKEMGDVLARGKQFLAALFATLRAWDVDVRQIAAALEMRRGPSVPPQKKS